jgi:hypothetical protein
MLECFHYALSRGKNPDEALAAALAQHHKELLGDEARRVAGEAAYLDFDPTGDFDLLDEPLRMTWEGNTAAGLEAAINSVMKGGDGG